MAKSRPSGAARKADADADSGLLREDASSFVLTDEVRNSVLNGELKAISVDDGRTMLSQGFSVTATDGNNYSFGSDLVIKYEHGIKQEGQVKKEGTDINRFRHIPFAVHALKSPNSDIYIKQGRINQKLFICRHSDRTVTAVYVNSDNRAVRSYIYTNRSKRQVDKFIESRKEGFEKA